MTSETKENISNEEPQLFERKEEKKGRGKVKFTFFLLVTAAAFLLWPRAAIRSEAVLQAEKYVQISLSDGGTLKTLVKKKGDMVRTGELIASYENGGLRKEYEQQGLLIEGLKEKKSILEAKAKLYESERERKLILLENAAIGKVLFEKAQLDALGAGKQIRMIEKEIQTVEKEAAYLKSRMDALEIKAPFDGIIITDPSEHAGSPVKAGEFVLEIADPASFFLEALIPEKDVQRISVGNTVQASFNSFPGKVYSGEISHIAPRTTEEIEKVFKVQHVIAIKIRLNELPQHLKYGMRAQIYIKSK